MKSAWYGMKAYYFDGLPRRFMVSLWGIPVFLSIMSDAWMGYLIAAGCLLFDILVVRNAPDVKLTQADIEAKFEGKVFPFCPPIWQVRRVDSIKYEKRFMEGGIYFYHTKKEFWRLLAVSTIGFSFIIAATWYSYAQELKYSFLLQLIFSTIILLVLAYWSARGAPLRSEDEIPEAEEPMRVSWLNEVNKRWIVYLSSFFLPGMWFAYGLAWIVTYYSFLNPDSAEVTFNSAEDFKATLIPISISFWLFLSYTILAPLRNIDHKLSYTFKSYFPKHLEGVYND